jgi:hypothetical protein
VHARDILLVGHIRLGKRQIVGGVGVTKIPHRLQVRRGGDLGCLLGGKAKSLSKPLYGLLRSRYPICGILQARTAHGRMISNKCMLR